MKKNIYLIAIFFISSIFISCEKDFLDSIPRGIVIAKTTADFRKLLDQVDNSYYTPSFSRTMSYVDILSDDVFLDSTKWNSYNNINATEHIKNLYVFKNTIWAESTGAFTSDTHDGNWFNQYYIISLCGSILSEIGRADDNPLFQKQMIAEAKVHRAYAYLLLINLYAPQYTASTAATTKGVPIVNNAPSLPPLVRNSVKEVYDFIIKDLEEAMPDLPDDVDKYKHRPTKLAVNAILARTYLYMGNYAKALEYSGKALQTRSYLYDYNTIYTGTVDFIGNLIGISRMNDEETILWKTLHSNPNASSQTYFILDTMSFNKLYPDFKKNANGTLNNFDLRRTLRFNAVALNRTITTKTVMCLFNWGDYRYKTDGNLSGSGGFNPVSTPEMYLTRAECNARDGKLQEALNDINAICTKRYKTGTFTPLTPTDFQNSKDKVLERVLLERRRELYGKDMRLFDLKRLNIAYSHNLGSLRISVPANDPRMVWPISTQYTEMNSELEQYDRTTTGVKYYNRLGVEVPMTD